MQPMLNSEEAVMLKLFVARLEDDFQKFLIARRPSDVLWWAAPLTG